jgi:ATP-dependent helicase/nuclease subunit A
VLANLQAFMQRALDVDSGRYPSLPRFLHELADLRAAPAEEAPDEGIVGDAGDAVRIYTVHGAKGLQAPIVWLLGAAAGQDAGRGYETQVDWPPEAEAPRSLTMWPRKDGQSAAQRRRAEDEARFAERENLNLLYVAMTRAQQVLIVSGSEGRGQEGSWYDKVRAAVLAASGATEAGGTVSFGDNLAGAKSAASEKGAKKETNGGRRADPRLNAPLPTGGRGEALTGRGLVYGTQFHALMDRLTDGAPVDRAAVQRMLGLVEREFAPMWVQAQQVLAAPALRRFFDAKQFKRAVNEVAYATGTGEVRRIDRLVEFDDGVWVLDYKTGDEKSAGAALIEEYRVQVADYCAVVAKLYPGRPVRGAIVFTDASVLEI